MLESKIQTQIKNALKKSGWLVIKLIQCSEAGMPDLLAIKQGRVVFLEVKQPGRKPRPLQVFRHKQLTEQGIEVFVPSCKQDILPLL